MNPRFASKCAAVLAATVVWTAGCSKKSETVVQATGSAGPSLAETRSIGEEGFIYGLPLVMNYAVMNEFAVDRENPQFKAPFNQIKNQLGVVTYTDTPV